MIEYAKIAFANYYQIRPTYMEFVNNIVLDWCKEKEQKTITSIPLTIEKRSNNLILKDLLINIKATFIWQSKDRQTSQYKWERFFKTIK